MHSAKFVWKVDIGASLKGLETGIKNKAMRIALNAAAAPVKSAIIATAPKDQGHLAKATVIKIKNYQNKGIWVAIVGAGSRYKRLQKTRPKSGGRGKVVYRKNKKGETVKAFIKPSRYQHLQDTGLANSPGKHYLPAAYKMSEAAFKQRCFQKLHEVIEQLMRARKG